MEKFEQHVSGVSPLQGAVDGTPVKRKRGERKANPNGLAESTFACRCHEQVFPTYGEYAVHLREQIDALQADLNEARNARHPDTGARLVAECGTISGYMRHRNKKVDPCTECRDAFSTHMREYERRKKAEDPEWAARRRGQHRAANERRAARQQAV